jgi:hypothetical protein
MKKNERSARHLTCNHILWLVGEFSYRVRFFLLLVKNHVQRVSVTKNKKTESTVFVGNCGNCGNRFKNNDLTPVSVTKKLPSYQDSKNIAHIDKIQWCWQNAYRTIFRLYLHHKKPP